jgi:hypothetical protein
MGKMTESPVDIWDAGFAAHRNSPPEQQRAWLRAPWLEGQSALWLEDVAEWRGKWQ